MRLLLAVPTAVLTLLAAGASASPTLAAPPPAPPAASPGGLASTGYVLGGASDALIARDAHGLATLGVDGVTLAVDGRSVDAPDSDETRLLATAHAQGLRAELLVSNYSDALGDFDPRAAARLLRHPSRVDAVATSLASYVAAQGWDGVQLDLESMSAPDAPGWSPWPSSCSLG